MSEGLETVSLNGDQDLFGVGSLWGELELFFLEASPVTSDDFSFEGLGECDAEADGA